MKIINGESFPDLKVSPNYGSDKLESGRLEDKIDVFEDQVSGWILDHAIRLTSPEYGGPPGGDKAGLILALTYFESIAQFMRVSNFTVSLQRTQGFGVRPLVYSSTKLSITPFLNSASILER